MKSVWVLSLTGLASLAGMASAAAIDDCLAAANVPVDAKGSTDWSQGGAPLMSKPGTSLSQVQQTDWNGGFAAYDNGDRVDVLHPYNQQEAFFSKSMATTALPAVCSYWTSTAKANSRQWYIIIDMMGGKSAYIPSIAANESSFAHRDKLFLYELYDRIGSGSYPSNGFGFLNGWADAFTKNLDDSQWGMYINYAADLTMNRTYAQQVYYRNSLPQLQNIKAAVDPGQVVDYPQAIVPNN